MVNLSKRLNPSACISHASHPGMGRQVKNWLKAMVYLLPSLLLFSVFVIYPFVRTVLQSLFLSDNRGFLTLFVGLQNYRELWGDGAYLTSLKTTFTYMLITVPLTIGLGLLLAVLSNQRLWGMRIFKTIFSSTMGISVAAGSVFWDFFFHPTAGLLNNLIVRWGGRGVGWLTDPRIALFSVAAVSIWINLGFVYLVLMGGLKNIDPSYYEGVDIVGGGFWYRLRRVTIPLLSPSLFFVFVTSIIHAFQTFGVVDMLTQGGPMDTTNLLVYGIYRSAFVNFQYGRASAQGILLFLIILCISAVQMKLTERWVTYQ